MNDARLLYQLQQEIERLKTQVETGRWVDWTPTVTQSVAVAVTVNFARYFISGKLAIVEAYLTVTGSGVAANAITMGGQPSAIYAANAGGARIIGSAYVRDITSSHYICLAQATTPTTWSFFTGNTINLLGSNPSFALAAGDIISINAAYKRA